jgi:hypothetical protein
MTDQQLVAARVAAIYRLIQSKFPGGSVDHFRHATAWRFRVTDPGRSKLLDVSDDLIQVYKAALNIEDILVGKGVLEMMQQATNTQRVLCSTDGVVINDVM